MAKRPTKRPPRVRRARPLLLVAAGLSLAAFDGCGRIIGNPGCPPSTCGDWDASVPELPPEADMSPSSSDDDGGGNDDGGSPVQ